MTSAVAQATALIVTDSNRARAHHWRSSQDTTGLTEHDDPRLDPLAEVSSDARLPVFTDATTESTTVARQSGRVAATATSYGEPFAYLPEHRPVMAIDGDPATAWTVGEHGDPLGETFRLYFDDEVEQILLVQAARPGARRITQLTIVGRDGSGSITGPTERIELDERSLAAPGQPIAVPPAARSLDLSVEAVAGGVPGTASAVSGVGFAEITSELGHATEIIRPPHDALLATDADTPLALSFSRLRVDPMNRWRDDPEPTLTRQFELPVGRTFDVRTTVRIDARTPDTELAAVLGWPAVASTRLTGSIRHAGVAALDGVADTAWITAFGEAQGATLAIAEITEPITEIAVRQPVGGFSRVTEITLRSGGEHRTVQLAPDAAGRSLADGRPAAAGRPARARTRRPSTRRPRSIVATATWWNCPPRSPRS